MSLATIRSAIQTTMQAVADIGVVTDFEPWATRKERFLTYFKAEALAYMQGWTITRESTLERKRDQQRTNSRVHVMVIRGYRAMDQEGTTEKDFQNLIETVCAALRVKELDHLDGTALLVGPPAVRIVETRTFAEYLVHYGEIALPVTEEVTF